MNSSLISTVMHAEPAAPAPGPALVEVRNLRISFRLDKHQYFEAVKDVSFVIPENSTVALVGESGSGKTVSAMSIVGLLPPESALVASGSEILYRGRNLVGLPNSELRALRGKEIAMIFQEPMTSLNPVFSVGDQIMEPLRLHRGLSKTQAHNRAMELLAEVGIPEPKLRLHAYPHELSGGQQQRVMIAIAIACDPKLLIADEPTTALDVTIQQQILDLIASLQRRHRMSVLFITHDLSVVADIADSVVVMQGGEVRESGDKAHLFERPQHPYTKALLACRPRLDRRYMRLPVIDDFMHGKSLDVDTLPQRSRGIKPDDEIILEAQHLKKDFYVREGLFGKRVIPAVKNASFTLAKGKTLGLVGESGSGKTTLGLTLMKLHAASGGRVLFKGEDILAMPPEQFQPYRRHIQIVFQNPFASLNPRFTVGHILLEPMRIHSIGANDAERIRMAQQLLDRVGLPQTALHKYPHEFSGGQRQRIAIARCLTMRPEVLICDESVSALDVSVQAQVLNLLQDLQDEFKMSYIFISHDLAVVKYIADQVMVMSAGEVVEIAGSDEIYRSPQHPYTQKLLGAIPRGWERGMGVTAPPL